MPVKPVPAKAGSLIADASRILLISSLILAGYGLGLAAWRFQGAAILLLALLLWRRLRRRRSTTDHGSAPMASTYEMERAGLFAEDGLLLGRALPETPPLPAAAAGLLSPSVSSETAVRGFLAASYSRRFMAHRLIRTHNHVHLATFSPAGGGKSTGAMIPNLLSYPGNCVIGDVKDGELWRETADFRRKVFGKKAYRLDPFGVCGPGGHTLNPFDFLDHTKEDFLDRVRAFAHPLIIREAGEKQPHFNDMAEQMLASLSSFVCACQPDRARRHLGTVRHCASSKDVYSQAVDLMRKSDAARGVIRRLAGRLTFAGEEEQGSIFTTFTRQTDFLDSELVARNVASSSFDPMDLKTGNADLWLILPHDMLESHSRLMRLWLNTVMARITGAGPDESRRVLWLLDEAAHYCRGMQVIEDAVTLSRGYGMRFWFIFQSLGQLKTTFGDKATTILDNIGTQQYFGINSYETADEISKRIGTTTIGTVSANRSRSSSWSTGTNNQNGGGNDSSSSGVTYSEIGRRLFLPEEILTLPDNLILIFHKNLPVIPALKLKSFEDPEFKGGRAAAPRRLGIAAAMLAGLTLYLGTLLANGGARVAAMPPTRWHARGMLRPGRPAGMPAAFQPQPGGQIQEMPPFPQPPRPRARRRRPGPSGFLIKIQ